MRKIMLRMVLLLLLTGIFGAALAQQLHFSLYSDRRGKQVGDVITVLIIEASKASNESGTQTAKEHGVSAQADRSGGGLLSFLPNFGIGAGSKANYSGKGETNRTGSLRAKVTARITEVLDNGNLMIEGSKVVEINNEKEILKVSGIIRQEDVGGDNTVYSYNIADAKIMYSGNGAVYTGQRPGIFARFFNWLF
jgi:flagellar L-ring protein precursor FlgH